MHLAIFSGHVALLVDYRVSQVVTFRFGIMFREAAQRQPDLIIQRQLFVSIEKILIQILLEVKDRAARHYCFGIHAGEVFGQANHLSALVSTLLDETRAPRKVLFNVPGGTELHQTHNAFEIVLLGRERMLVVCNSVQYA